MNEFNRDKSKKAELKKLNYWKKNKQRKFQIELKKQSV
jgi:hypothetical protein